MKPHLLSHEFKFQYPNQAFVGGRSFNKKGESKTRTMGPWDHGYLLNVWGTAGHVAHLLSAASLAQGLENLQILQVGELLG